MPELERELTELGAALAWPATPRLRVVLPVHGVVRGGARRRSWVRILAAAAAIVLAAGALLTYAPTREAIAGFLNLHTAVHRVPVLASPSPGAGQRLGLGVPTTLARAQSELSWRIAVPAALGQPDEVYLAVGSSAPSGGEVTLVYRSAPGIRQSGQTGVAVLVTEARGSVDEQFFGKLIGPDATIEDVSVGGHKGWWIAGAPHEFFLTDRNGSVINETLRLATNTLLIDDNGTVVRIEGDTTRQQALQIAGSL